MIYNISLLKKFTKQDIHCVRIRLMRINYLLIRIMLIIDNISLIYLVQINIYLKYLNYIKWIKIIIRFIKLLIIHKIMSITKIIILTFYQKFQ